MNLTKLTLLKMETWEIVIICSLLSSYFILFYYFFDMESHFIKTKIYKIIEILQNVVLHNIKKKKSFIYLICLKKIKGKHTKFFFLINGKHTIYILNRKYKKWPSKCGQYIYLKKEEANMMIFQN